nr:DEAD/DEAH box helicase [Planctomycetota bacterium]
MQPEPFQVDEPEEEELPDLAGLAPVRSLAQLKAVPTRAPREKLSPTAALSKYWGYHEFRPLQAEAVASVLAGRDCLIVLPTGGGKSLCYQVPAACGAGAVLVVSPLIALMDDQVASAREAGLSAAALHGNLDESERRRARELLAAGALDLLYVSPERLCVGDLVPVLAGKIALAAVDEAHC